MRETATDTGMMRDTEVGFRYRGNDRLDGPDRETVRAENRALMVRVVHIFIVFGLLTTLLLAFMLKPDPRGLGTHEQLFLLPCNFYALTGLPCPFCGTTTAFAHMAHGQVRDAFIAQPLGVLGFVACVLLLPFSIGAAISGKNLMDALARLPWGRLSWPLGAIVLVSWLFKIIVTVMH